MLKHTYKSLGLLLQYSAGLKESLKGHTAVTVALHMHICSISKAAMRFVTLAELMDAANRAEKESDP